MHSLKSALPLWILVVVLGLILATCAAEESEDSSSNSDPSDVEEVVDETPDIGSATSVDADEIPTEVLDLGKTLYARVSSANLSCASCHGPEADRDAPNFSPVSASAPDLASSSLSGADLRTKIASMWNINAGHGAESFASLDTSEQDALVTFLLSVRN